MTLDDATDFRDVTGYTPETMPPPAEDTAQDEKRRAALDWLAEITALEALQRERAELEADMVDKVRVHGEETARAWRLAEQNAQARIRSWCQHAQALNPPAWRTIEYAAAVLELNLLYAVPDAVRLAAFSRIERYADAWLATLEDEPPEPEARKLHGIIDGWLARMGACSPVEGEDVPAALLRFAALMDGPEPPDVHRLSEGGKWNVWLESATVEELQADIERKEAELAAPHAAAGD